jgi:predicted secreted hydrolase
MAPIAFGKARNGANIRLAGASRFRAADGVCGRAVSEDQLALGPITYWEGAIDASGMRDGRAIKGRGYLELTGYAGRLSETLNR